MSYRARVLASGSVGLLLAAAAAGTALGAVQIVELSAQRVVPGTVVTMRVATTARQVATEPGRLFMIPSGTWGDSPDSLHCEQVGRAVEVGQIHWRPGTVDYEGATYEGFKGESTFTVPQLAVDTYRLAETIDARGTGCHIFTSIEVVAGLPDTAFERADAPSVVVQTTVFAVAAVILSLSCRWTWRVVGRTRR